MSVLIIGGDKIAPITGMLHDFGVKQIVHWTARNQKRGRKKDKPIPIDIKIVVMLTNFLNHNAMKHYRAEAKAKSIPIVYSTRSTECLKKEFVDVLTQLDKDSHICKECEHYLSCYTREM